MLEAMNERRRLILKLVVQEYVDGSVPISSELLVRKYGLSVSSATIRNELSALEELGYLTHLHTSAGRVPTDAGYRYFVENLMDRTPLTATEQRMIRHQFYQVRTELDQWIQLAGAVLARTAQNASVVTPPRAYQARFKHLELISIHDTTVLLVLVLHDGTIRQQSLTLDTTRSQEELSRSAARINDQCADTYAERIEELLHERDGLRLDDLERQVLDVVVRSMQQFEEQLNSAIHSDGLIEVLNQPEFAKVTRIRQMVEILQGGKGLGPLIPRALASSGVQVVIGGEHGADDMREYSVVLSRYGIDGEVAGVLGIIGPTRMAYPRAISAVRYIATVMSDLLGELYGTDSATR
ncbi:MAG TPA: heat-inducible transcriptional repressor HrcA [Roseiflexaceae bacterium]|nr:heat-inducible transcriptional repressor HrcA [Roseiflexaceae bacterium]HMP39808.1 heat-inducible transcriptional repressor HrcA [Roseiflexaceae bacterium]